jgi:L-rhamnose mutarotase
MIKVMPPSGPLKRILEEYQEQHKEISHSFLSLIMYGHDEQTIYCSHDNDLLDCIENNKYVITVGAFLQEESKQKWIPTEMNGYENDFSKQLRDHDHHSAKGIRFKDVIFLDNEFQIEINFILEKLDTLKCIDVKIWYNITLRPDVPWEQDWRLEHFRTTLNRLNP